MILAGTFSSKSSLKKAVIKLLFLSLLVFGSNLSFASDFKSSDLHALLLKNSKTYEPVESIGEMIAALPHELRSNFTFVYKSRSPFKESISFEYPRTILFSTDSRFVMTYTGDPNKPGYGTVETMEFDDEDSKFKFKIFDLNEKNKISKNLSVSS